MHQTRRVSLFQRDARIEKPRDYLHRARRNPGRTLREILAFEILHDEERLTAREATRVVNANHMVASKLRDRASLAPKAPQRVSLGHHVAMQHLDCDRPAKLELRREIDAAHAARSK